MIEIGDWIASDNPTRAVSLLDGLRQRCEGALYISHGRRDIDRLLCPEA